MSYQCPLDLGIICNFDFKTLTKEHTVLLEMLHLRDPWFSNPKDFRAIISDNQVVPQLKIKGMIITSP